MLRTYYRSGEIVTREILGMDCIECFKKYSGYNPFCSAYISDSKRDANRMELLRELKLVR